jgi:hypothetical protein
MHKTATIVDTLAWFCGIRLLSEFESRIVESLFEPCFEFAEVVKLAESIHIHLKVEDTETLPFDDFVHHGGVRASGRLGNGKYCFPEGVHTISLLAPTLLRASTSFPSILCCSSGDKRYQASNFRPIKTLEIEFAIS